MRVFYWANMSDTKLILGNFAFSAYEIPEAIPFGGGQKLAVHKLPGGARVVQAMGRDDMPLAWSGLFLGAQARERAQYVDYLRTQGKPLKLTWDQFQYTVVIESFSCAFERFYKLPYSISCLVVSDDAAPTEGFTESGFDRAMTADNATAQGLGPLIGDATLTGLLSTMDAAIKSVSTFANQTQTVINGIIAPVAAVQQRVQVLTASVVNTVNNAATLGGVIPNASVAQAVGRLSAQLTGVTQLPLLSQLGSVTGRIVTNLNIINGTAGAISTITVAGGTLFDVAAAHYGDPAKWPVLAKANNLTDPNLSGVVTLKVPKIAYDTGGLITP